MSTTYLFAGGGTGGHLFPGLAIAEQISSCCAGAGVKTVFACSTRPLDTEILRAQAVEFEPVRAEPFSLSPARFLKFLFSWRASVAASRALLRAHLKSGPVHTVAMGGFVAAPLVKASIAEKLPVTLVNLDAVPGRANRWIAGHASSIFTSAEVNLPGWTLVPPIVRRQAMPPGPPDLCRTRLRLDPRRPTLLVTGASQGARSINDFLLALLASAPDAFRARAWQIIHQTGKGESDRVRDAYRAAGIPALVTPFLDDMGAAWGAADLAVSRSGAGSVAEAWASSTPAIFLPYPYHKDEHQRVNALPLERASAAIIARDLIDPAANAASVGPRLTDLLTNPAALAAMRAAYAPLGPADGAERIARALLSA